jgi:hypothetical protein
MTPHTIQFSGTGGTWVMRITADRRIEVNEDVEVTDAAQKVLDALQHLLKPAPVQEPYKGISEHMTKATKGRVRIDPVTGDVGIGTPPAQPAVPDAITDNSETPEYIQGWNDCRQAMLRHN